LLLLPTPLCMKARVHCRHFLGRADKTYITLLFEWFELQVSLQTLSPHMAFGCDHLSVSSKERYAVSFHIRESTIGRWVF
jgi:hypothetical protein